MLFDRKSKAQNAAPPEAGAALEMEARVKRRRNRMAGLWAAELLGLIGKAAQDYAHEVAHAHEHHADDEHVIRRLAADLKGKVTVHEIREKLAHLVHEAKRQLRHEDRHPKDGTGTSES